MDGSSLLITSLCWLTLETHVSALSPHIIGGRNAKEGEFPYQISLQRKYYFGGGSYHWCGGAVIDKTHILTAAHCTTGIPLEEFLVFPGILNLSETNYYPNYTLSAIYRHEDYNSSDYFNDIAILKLQRELVYSSDVQPIALRSDSVRAGTYCDVTGWGLVNVTSALYPDILQAAVVPVEPHALCAETYDITEGMMCAGYPRGGVDACSGDSGGPLECAGLLTGVVSAGDGCALPNLPGVYTEVSVYHQWIERKLRL
ncbi:trypsin II-P29-like [Bacillus rossius redtenbacheri]|uniref:trypsin II-P29-like n=1 Tax=Bacillus rossius redtenbacheri TaxID=93214 RepID=UPI002FDD95F9